MTERLLRMPRLGETMEEGKIVGWLIKPGDSFRRGDPILEIETDKTVAEYPALGSGRLTEILVDRDRTIEVGAPIARIDLGEGPDWTGEEGGDRSAAPVPAPAPASDPADGVEVDLPMPRLGETMEEGRLVRWLKEPGERFSRGEAIVEIETDKTLAEFPALTDGVLHRILRHQDDRVAVGEAIARIVVAPADAPVGAEATAAPAAPAGIAVARPESAPVNATPEPATPAPGTGPLRATPLARRLARHHGVDLRSVQGTGRRGRIEKQDVLRLEPRERAIAPSPSSAAPEGVQFLSLTSGRMAFTDSGGPGEAYLLIHGYSGDRTTWATMISALQRAGRRVVALDLPGHGLTESEARTVGDLHRDLPAFVEALGLERFHVVAHSLGAVVAVELALAMAGRVTSLCLLAPAGLGSEIDRDFIGGMAAVETGGELAHLLRRLSVSDGTLSEAALDNLLQQLGGRRLTALAAAVAGVHGQRVDIVHTLQRLHPAIPVRVIVGLEDRIIPWTQVKALPPRVAIHLLSRSGHMPQWDQPRDVAEILLPSARGN